MSKSYKLLGNMGSQYGANFQGFTKPEFDIDTLKYKEGWRCVMYSGAKKICETKDCASQKIAEEQIVLLIVALPSDQKPADLNTILWNTVQYRDFPGASQFNGVSSYVNTTHSYCDHDPDELKDNKLKNSPFSIGKVSIIGAIKSKIGVLAKRKGRRLIVNCSGTAISAPAYTPKPVEKPFTQVPKGFETLFTQDYAWNMPPVEKVKLFYGDEIVVDWPDGKAAPLHPRFWVNLLLRIQSDEFQAKYADVVFCCFGGHGRTGTALASLAICTGIYSSKGVTFKSDPKRIPTESEKAEVWIQHDYCKKAVESDDQTEYLAHVEEYVASLKKEEPQIG